MSQSPWLRWPVCVPLTAFLPKHLFTSSSMTALINVRTNGQLLSGLEFLFLKKARQGWRLISKLYSACSWQLVESVGWKLCWGWKGEDDPCERNCSLVWGWGLRPSAWRFCVLLCLHCLQGNAASSKPNTHFCFTGKRQVWLVWCVCVFSVQNRPVASCGNTAIIPAVDLELQLYPSQQELPAATLMNTWQFLLPPHSKIIYWFLDGVKNLTGPELFQLGHWSWFQLQTSVCCPLPLHLVQIFATFQVRWWFPDVNWGLL